MTDRAILHVDLNCFYASVETVLNPALRGQPIAVCGDEEARHGIVLAKSEPAKQAGVKTGMTNAEAKRTCPGLIIVPPHFSVYQTFSRLARRIYLRYSERVEPFGLDENWIDISGSEHRFATPLAAAEEIRETVKRELGLSVSVGVSFNKIFAKLGSDLKKPDAVTVISRENFRETVWRLPVSELLFVGRATTERLRLAGIRTIGDLAQADPDILRLLLGKNGHQLWEFANGRDRSPVMRADAYVPEQSIGHGITTREDLTDDEEIRRVFLELAQEVGTRLRGARLWATGVQIAVRDKTLDVRQFDGTLPHRTQNAGEIAEGAFRLYREKYRRDAGIRSLTVRATHLLRTAEGGQYDLFYDRRRVERVESLDRAVDDIRRAFGTDAIRPAAIMLNTKTRLSQQPVCTLPNAVRPAGK